MSSAVFWGSITSGIHEGTGSAEGVSTPDETARTGGAMSSEDRTRLDGASVAVPGEGGCVAASTCTLAARAMRLVAMRRCEDAASAGNPKSTKLACLPRGALAFLDHTLVVSDGTAGVSFEGTVARIPKIRATAQHITGDAGS